MMAAKPEERGRRQGAAGVPRHGRGREHLPQDRPGRRRAPTASADTARLQRAAEEGGRAHRLRPSNIAQFLDRDTRPDFASTVMIPALQEFIKNPNDIDGLTKSIENQKKSIFV